MFWSFHNSRTTEHHPNVLYAISVVLQFWQVFFKQQKMLLTNSTILTFFFSQTIFFFPSNCQTLQVPTAAAPGQMAWQTSNCRHGQKIVLLHRLRFRTVAPDRMDLMDLMDLEGHEAMRGSMVSGTCRYRPGQHRKSDWKWPLSSLIDVDLPMVAWWFSSSLCKGLPEGKGLKIFRAWHVNICQVAILKHCQLQLHKRCP